MGFKEGGERRHSRPSGGFQRGPRETHDITCSECGAQAQVPFKPIEGKPVFCKDCHMKRKNTQ